jgi:hypothetical protein
MSIVDQHMQAWLAQPHPGSDRCSLDQLKHTLRILMCLSLRSKWPF